MQTTASLTRLGTGAGLLAVLALGLSACGSSTPAATPPSTQTATTQAAPTPPPPPPSPTQTATTSSLTPTAEPTPDGSDQAADLDPVGEGSVVSAKTLFELWAFVLPPFPVAGASADALWSPALPEKDGYALVNFMDGETGYVGMEVLDCHRPDAKPYVDTPDDRGSYGPCFITPAADSPMVGDYPRLDTDDYYKDSMHPGVTIRVGHVIIDIGPWAGPDEDQITKDDLVAYLATVDFSSLED